MTWVRHITDQFSLVYLRPSTVARAVKEILPAQVVQSLAGAAQHHRPRHPVERRSLTDRRQSRQPVIIDTRSSHSRRLHRDRRFDAGTNSLSTPAATGIDVYA